ncbi:hypothetical protein [Glycomyces tritici]|uniref:Uncharacterized protein n=1 Tax=Glycomyces tritici TaxID=2665176 RepID=A0ABT7YWT0_9ACTN|nr:hypothetical protein [Glycomyces tritici]MDN3243047.1 hypothetical protein [Glycomyces tritici]
MTDPRSAAFEQTPDAKTMAKQPRRWMPMSPRSVGTSLRGAKTQAIIPLRECGWAADLQAGDKVDLRAKKNAQIRSLQVEVVRACRHVTAEEIPACGSNASLRRIIAETMSSFEANWAVRTGADLVASLRVPGSTARSRRFAIVSPRAMA